MINKKKKILYLIQLPPPVHGVSITNKIVYNSQVINDGFDNRIIRIQFSEEVSELRQFSIKKLFRLFQISVRLKWELFMFRPDMVYFSLIPVGNGFLRDSIFALIIKLFRRKVVYHLNNRGIAEFNKKVFFRSLYKFVFNNSVIIHVSEGLLKQEIETLALRNTKLFSLGNTIEQFTVNRKTGKGTVRLLFLSNYFPQKGLMVLLEAVKSLKDRGIGFILNAYGSSYNENVDLRCRKYIDENELNKHVFVHGPVYGNEKHKVFEETDIYVFPSYFSEECFPLSILEAMNARLPVIASAIGAIPEIIDDEKNGYLVEPGEPFLLSKKIEMLVREPEIGLIVGNNAYEKFNMLYSLPVFENKMRSIFNFVINQE